MIITKFRYLGQYRCRNWFSISVIRIKKSG